jgi:RNA polymerase sigma factor (sigma-70 family)
MKEHDPELLALAWELLAQEWDVLKKMCSIAARKDRMRQDTWEEAMSEVCAHLPDFLWSYDPSAGRTLRSHVIGNARWYLFKMFVTKKRVRKDRTDQLARAVEAGYFRSESKCPIDELDDQMQVQSILNKVHPFHRSILQLYYMSGLTYEEIGGVLGCCKATAMKRVQSALNAVRQSASEML